MREEFLNFVWQHQLFDTNELKTTQDQQVQPNFVPEVKNQEQSDYIK